MPETTPLIKAALNLRGGAGFDVYRRRGDSMLTNTMKEDLTQGLVDLFSDSILAIILYGSVARNDNTDESDIDIVIHLTTLIISKKPGNTGISRDIRTEFTTDLLLSD